MKDYIIRAPVVPARDLIRAIRWSQSLLRRRHTEKVPLRKKSEQHAFFRRVLDEITRKAARLPTSMKITVSAQFLR